jgi:hypothetical protein
MSRVGLTGSGSHELWNDDGLDSGAPSFHKFLGPAGCAVVAFRLVRSPFTSAQREQSDHHFSSEIHSANRPGPDFHDDTGSVRASDLL